MSRPKPDRVPVLRCSFCGVAEPDTEDLVAGPEAYICGTCIDLSYEIVQAARARRAAKENGPQGPLT